MSRFQIIPTHKDVVEGGVTKFNPLAIGDNSVISDDLKIRTKLSDGSFQWITGLSQEDIKYSKYLKEEEKEVALKQLEEDYEKLKQVYSEDALKNTNANFWGEGKKGQIHLDSSTEHSFFDTELNPQHIIIKYGILSGSYDAIAPSFEMAMEHRKPFFMTSLEDINKKNFEPVNEKLKAFSELNEFLEKQNEENVLWFAWALDDSTRGFSSTNGKNTVAAKLVEYLEGKLTKGLAKKKVVEKVRTLLKEWKIDEKKVKGKAVFYAGLNYGHIIADKGFYMTTDRRTKLATTIEDSIDIILDPINREELIELRDAVKKSLTR